MRIFTDYLKGPKGKKDKKQKSLLDVIIELDSHGSQASIYKLFEIVKEKTETLPTEDLKFET